MDTRGVTTLVSDSGVTRYRINTEEWLVFDRKNPPYWAFEKGGLFGEVRLYLPSGGKYQG